MAERYSGTGVIRMMWLALVNFIIGIAFGFFHKGTENYRDLLRNGAVTGIIVSVILLLLSMVLLPGEITSGFAFVGVFSVLVVIILFVVIFMIGAFVGDRIERIIRK